MSYYYASHTWRWGGWKKPLWRRIRDFFDDTENITSQKQQFSQPLLKDSRISIRDFKSENTTDFPVIDISLPIPQFKFHFTVKNITIPIKTISLSFSKKVRTVYIPSIAIDIQSLKKTSIVFVFISVFLILICATFSVWRIVSLTDGDYLGKTYMYKVNRFLEDRVIPLEASTNILNERVGNLEIKEEARSYKEQVNYKPVVKQYNIYNSNKNLIKTKIVE